MRCQLATPQMSHGLLPQFADARLWTSPLYVQSFLRWIETHPPSY